MPKIIFLILMILLTGCGQANSNNTTTTDLTGFIGEKEPVTRAEAAKALALSQYSPEQINNLERIIQFNDTDVIQWYDKYINAAYTAKLISGTTDETFSPDDYLTLVQAQQLIKKINSRGNFELKYNEADKDKPISYKIWLEAFSRAVDDKITNCNIFIYATGNDCKELGDYYILCNGGLRHTDGIDCTPYKDKTLNVIMKGTEIIGLVKVVDENPKLENISITDSDKNSITVQLNGATRKFNIDNSNNTFNTGDNVNITFDKSGQYQIELCQKN